MKRNSEILNIKAVLVLCAGFFSLQMQALGFVNDRVQNNNIYLFRAAKNGDIDWVKKLIERDCANVNYKTSSGKTVLIKAVSSKNGKVVKYLLTLKDKAGKILVNINAQDKNGQTALHKSVKNGEIFVSKILALAGADKNKQDRWGNTPLHIAAKNGFIDISTELLACNNSNNCINLEIKNNNGDTPFNLAVKANYKLVVELLIKNGARTNAKNNSGKLPVDFARGEVKKLLDKKA